AYILWMLQRVYLGPEYKGPHGEALTPMTPREVSIALPLAALAILLGVYPHSVFRYTDATITQQVEQLAQLTRQVKTPQLATAPAEATVRSGVSGEELDAGEEFEGQEALASSANDTRPAAQLAGAARTQPVARELPSAHLTPSDNPVPSGNPAPAP